MLEPSAKHCPKATRADLTTGRPMFHHDCGSLLRREVDYSYYRGMHEFGPYFCSKRCAGHSWTPERMARFTDAELGDRFHTRPRPDCNVYVLVYKDDPITRRKFACLELESVVAANPERYSKVAV